MDMQRFGQQLKTFRQQRRLTQMELAQRSEVPQPLISDLEAGKREGVTLEMAWRLARELSVSLDHLAGTWDQAEDSARAAAEQKTRRGRPRKAAPAAKRAGGRVGTAPPGRLQQRQAGSGAATSGSAPGARHAGACLGLCPQRHFSGQATTH